VKEAPLSLVEQRYLSKKQMIALMQSGHSWQDAAKQAGVRISRSSAYRLLQAVRLRGEAALQDGRHGHPAKLHKEAQAFLEAMCRQTPELPSREVQVALQKRFGVLVSVGHLNHLRARLGLGSRAARAKKKVLSAVPRGSPIGKMVQEHCFSSQRPTKRAWLPC
jgi:transposase